MKKFWISILSLFVIYWITRFSGFLYMVGYTSLDYIVVFIVGVTIIVLASNKMNYILVAVSFVSLVLVVYVSWFSSNFYSPILNSPGNPTKYYITENADYFTKGNDPIKDSPKYLSKYKIYERVIGPIYIKKKELRYRTHEIRNMNDYELEEILKESNL